MSWEPRSITTDPLSYLVDSQTLEEDLSGNTVQQPTTTSNLDNTRSSVRPLTQRTSSISSSSLLTSVSSTNLISSTTSHSTLTNVPNSQSSVVTSSQSITSLLVPHSNGNGPSVSNGSNDIEMQSEDNPVLHELQPRTVNSITEPSGPLMADNPGITKKETKEADSMENIMTKLWKIPDKGTFRNPYFGGRKEGETNGLVGPSKKKDEGPKKESNNAKENNSRAKNNKIKNNKVNIPFIDNDPRDDTDSVNEPSTTDESDDSQTNRDSSVNSSEVKKRRSKRKITLKQSNPNSSVKNENLSHQTDTKGAIKIDEDKKVETKSEIIPGLGSPTPNTTEEGDLIKDENKDGIKAENPQNINPIKVDPMEICENPSEVNNDMVTSNEVATEVNPMSSVNGASEENEVEKPKCIRIGCCNTVVDHSDWDTEYCSFKCAVEHCKAAFFNWTESRKSEATC